MESNWRLLHTDRERADDPFGQVLLRSLVEELLAEPKLSRFYFHLYCLWTTPRPKWELVVTDYNDSVVVAVLYVRGSYVRVKMLKLARTYRYELSNQELDLVQSVTNLLRGA